MPNRQSDSRAHRFDFPSIRNVRFRRTDLIVWLAVVACWMAWPVPRAVAAQADACELLTKKIAEISAEAVEKLPGTKPPNSNNRLRYTVNVLVSKLSPFAAEVHNAKLANGTQASVTFEGDRFKQIKDSDVGKVCLRVIALSGSNPYAKIEQVNLFEKGQDKGLKIAFKVEASPIRWYWPWATVDYLVFGVIDDPSQSPPSLPTYFSHRATFKAADYWVTAVLSVVFLAVFYLALACVTYPSKEDLTKSGEPKDAKNADDPKKIEKPDEMKEPVGGQWLLFFLSPVRISAAWFGEASMSQLQVLIFTFVVAGLMLNIFLRTESLTELSMDVLKLIGISAVGTVGAKLTQTLKTGLKPETAGYLIAKGWYQWELRPIALTANFRQLLLTDKRLDIYKFQMLIFTAIVALYILSAGQTTLEGVKISDTMIYLLGISQLVYVGGKAVTDRTTDLEDAVAKMRELEPKLKGGAGTPDEKAEYQKAEETAAEEFAFLQNRIRPTPDNPGTKPVAVVQAPIAAPAPESKPITVVQAPIAAPAPESKPVTDVQAPITAPKPVS